MVLSLGTISLLVVYLKVQSRVHSFLLVDISTSFGENRYANLSLLRNRKFDLIALFTVSFSHLHYNII